MSTLFLVTDTGATRRVSRIKFRIVDAHFTISMLTGPVHPEICPQRFHAVARAVGKDKDASTYGMSYLPSPNPPGWASPTNPSAFRYSTAICVVAQEVSSEEKSKYVAKSK